MESLKPRLSVVIPFHQGTEFLRQSLGALRHLDGLVELIVVADGALGDYEAVASEHGARVVKIAGPSGPSVARNRGASAANGDILVFVDADVVVAPDALPRIAELFASHPDVAAVMGAYDESPAEANFVSQFKNLAHSFVHQSSKSDAQSFWAGLGAVRTDVFRNVGGFDERYTRPCIEDIDLGYRLTKAGYRIVLDPSIRGCHLKRWTFLSLLRTDFWDRGVPWTQLILRSELLQNDLNVRTEDRVSVVLAFVVLGLVPASLLTPLVLLPVVIAAALLYQLNRRFYAFFADRRGVGFALRVVPLHFCFHIYSGLSFAVGMVVYAIGRVAGVTIPGAIPLQAWDRTSLVGDSTVRIESNGSVR